MKKKRKSVHLKCCRRCDTFYRTPAKFSKFCTNCYLGPWDKRNHKKIEVLKK